MNYHYGVILKKSKGNWTRCAIYTDGHSAIPGNITLDKDVAEANLKSLRKTFPAEKYALLTLEF